MPDKGSRGLILEEQGKNLSINNNWQETKWLWQRKTDGAWDGRPVQPLTLGKTIVELSLRDGPAPVSKGTLQSHKQEAATKIPIQCPEWALYHSRDHCHSACAQGHASCPSLCVSCGSIRPYSCLPFAMGFSWAVTLSDLLSLLLILWWPNFQESCKTLVVSHGRVFTPWTLANATNTPA